MVRVCFVCLGNICRSPTAEGVMRQLLRDAGLEREVQVDSAGTAAYHAGEAPDSRARAAALSRGFELSGAARRFERADWDRFDLVLAMDTQNRRDLAASAPSAGHLQKLHLLRDFDPEGPDGASVPDPYYGGEAGFHEVIDICERACHGLLAHIFPERSRADR